MWSSGLFNQLTSQSTAIVGAGSIDWKTIGAVVGFTLPLLGIVLTWIRWSHQQGRTAQQIDHLLRAVEKLSNHESRLAMTERDIGRLVAEVAALSGAIEGQGGFLARMTRLETLAELATRRTEELTRRAQ